jgi:tRNA (guanine-N7-)-methyltransferase
LRSFVLREGRLTSGQQRALDEYLPRFGIPWSSGETLDLDAVFGNNRGITLEIGFGNGEALLAAAKSAPGRNFLGVEVHRPGIGRLLAGAAEAELTNLRIIRADAMDLLCDGLPPGSLEEIRLFFPDPWPKSRHHKRRIFNRSFLECAARALYPRGTLHCATDWADYAEQMLALLQASPDFHNTISDGGFAPRPAGRVETRFERRGMRLGHVVRDLVFRRAG